MQSKQAENTFILLPWTEGSKMPKNRLKTRSIKYAPYKIGGAYFYHKVCILLIYFYILSYFYLPEVQND